MWQEARKQEKKLRGIMIDYKKRAERRQAYYQKMRMDPHQLIRLYAQRCKFHIAIESTGDSSMDGRLMPWQGDSDILIDRFDVRAHLDYLPEEPPTGVKVQKTEADEKEERMLNYERYRTLVQIDATGATEESYLKQLGIEEEYGKKQVEAQKLQQKDRLAKPKAKIHYAYEDTSVVAKGESEEDDESDDESDSDVSDIDISVDVLELTHEQKTEMDALATQYGIGYGQYCKQLLFEKKEYDFLKKLEEEEEERSKLPGRKGKRARRTLREKQKTLRGSPLSFAVRSSPHDDEGHESAGSRSSSHSSRSRSPHRGEGKIEFITEFGGAADEQKAEDKCDISSSSRSRVAPKEPSSSHSRDTHSRRERHRSRSASRSPSRGHRSRHSRSRSRSKSDRRPHSRSRSRSRSRGSRSHSHSGKHDNKHSSSSTSSSRTRYRSRRDSSSNRRPSRGSRSRSREPSSRSRDHASKPVDEGNHKRVSRSRSIEKSYSKRPDSRSPVDKDKVAMMLNSAEKAKGKVVDKLALTAREKLKLRMQKLLNKQVKEDKRTEKEKTEAKEMEQEERDAEIYEMTRRMRQKEREKKMNLSGSHSPPRIPSRPQYRPPTTPLAIPHYKAMAHREENDSG